MSIPFSVTGEKALPDTPSGISNDETAVAHEDLVPSCKIASFVSTDKALPPIRVENTLPEQDMSRLHELWNEAGLSARAHRRRRRGPNPIPRRIPAPIFIPEPDDMVLTLPSADTSIAGTTPPTTGSRKRWGFLSAKWSVSEKQEVQKKSSNALKILRAIGQDRLRKKLRYARSAPNLGDQSAPLRRGVALPPAIPRPVEVVPKDASAGSPCTPSSVGEIATPKSVLDPEDMDGNAIYFTMDPAWRASQGSAQFQFITPIPGSPTSLGRPDSPLLHRHYSLDQLSFAAQEATRALTAKGFPVAYPSDEILHPIDELHAYLEL